jgi:hypothetical protein
VILDSQSVRTTEKGGRTATTGPSGPSGRKRHLLVDTLGLICKAYVTPANISDRDGARGLLRRWTGDASPGCGMAGWTRATAASSWTGSSSTSG